ncbi:phosphotransferase [Paenibacillus sp. UNC451MF]|uniref:phosphotransferase n=1 Tax=Paenibacillus sp. UNC451MF TaxID=1449063 RepID=UPI000491E5AF|nr:phosphotransferase [Paenibacillus sp. UNC451MF]
MDKHHALQKEIKNAYFKEIRDVWTKPVSYGVNNTTCYVFAGEDRYVFRVYDNRRDEQPIQYELAVLAALKQEAVSFEIPVPVHNHDGQLLTRLDNGQIGVLFHCIPGERPNTEDTYLFGKAAGELSHALSRVMVLDKPPYRGSYHLYEVHPLISKEMLHDLLSDPWEQSDVQAADFMLKELLRMEGLKPAFSLLPHQLVHGDLALSNVLLNDGRISGILDFEFCSPDVRAMELAVGLMSYVHEESSFSAYAESFISGYSEHASLSADEISMLPDLIKLRYMGSFIHHLGRYAAKVGSLEAAQKRLHQFQNIAEKLDRVEEALLKHGFLHFLDRS